MDIVTKVADAISDCAAKAVDQNVGEPYYHHIARAALAAMLEAVGEPVAWMYDCDGDVWATPITPEPTVDDDWTETPLYSLAALREGL